MLSEAQLKEWMHENLTYELLMVRYTHARLHSKLDQMEWNASFGAFALYARNLQWFLTNSKGRSELPRKVRACDYASHFKADDSKIANIMWDLHEEVYHAGSQRVGKAKTGRDKADEVFAWVEEWMDKFVREIQRTVYKSSWGPDRADPSKVAPTSAEQRVESNNPSPVTVATILSPRRCDKSS
jgi:hypothetical protein